MDNLLTHRNTFDCIESFIEHMKQNESVIGIVEYGGRTYTDMSVGGDYDLTIIFDKPVSKNFSGFAVVYNKLITVFKYNLKELFGEFL
ncbi:hypothetical protein [Clostridium sp. C8-1-8]|uniref:hypothetical protein n=1 Tax=Clostridium sp. C8-1-8 TaxID=2698831 RepID=UPI001A9B9440|nr:hypothetical protein [Clostridium sp. C8-1-8]